MRVRSKRQFAMPAYRPVRPLNDGEWTDKKDSPAKVNCALVTAAAIVSNGTGQHHSSGMVAQEIVNSGVPVPQSSYSLCPALAPKKARPGAVRMVDGAFQEGNSAGKGLAQVSNIQKVNDGQIGGMLDYCGKKLGDNRFDHVTKAGEVPLTTAMSKMTEFPVGTMFGVLVQGGDMGHWNYAEVCTGDDGGKRVTFTDYQSDHVNANGPQSGDRPQLAITNFVLPADQDPKVHVLAFAKVSADAGPPSPLAQSATVTSAASTTESSSTSSAYPGSGQNG